MYNYTAEREREVEVSHERERSPMHIFLRSHDPIVTTLCTLWNDNAPSAPALTIQFKL